METWVAPARQMPLTYSHKDLNAQDVQEAQVFIVILRMHLNCDSTPSFSGKTDQVAFKLSCNVNRYSS